MIVGILLVIYHDDIASKHNQLLIAFWDKKIVPDMNTAVLYKINQFQLKLMVIQVHCNRVKMCLTRTSGTLMTRVQRTYVINMYKDRERLK